MILSNEYGIDPGSYAIKIYDRDNERFYSDHNALACDMAGHVIAYGQSAYEMKGSTPRSITIKNSVQAGKITDVLLLEAIIEPLLYRDRRFLGIRPSIYFSVPADMTEIERRAYASISKRGKLKNCNVFLVERAFADAFALGLSVKDAKGIMVLNIGSSQTTASVSSNGRIIL
ncbi:MAG: rod shape-determining protein, partial [Mogibacterium sp.]|nr:rod shape-determining protein [Mogibacterium sp.]